MKIAYFPEGDRNLASSRLRVYKIADALTRQGQTVVFNPASVIDFDVVVVQKRAWEHFGRDGMNALGLTAYLVWDVDDWWPGGPADLVDLVTVDTREKLRLYPGAVVIPDCLDVDEGGPRKIEHRDELRRVVWFGGGDNLKHASHAAEAARRVGLEFVLITRWNAVPLAQIAGIEGIQWRIDTVDAEIIKADLAVCPYRLDENNWVMSKSANRLHKAWALGMPCAGTPIPSYLRAGLQYQAHTVEEWINVYRELADPEVRQADAVRGELSTRKYGADIIARRWLEVFALEHEAGG